MSVATATLARGGSPVILIPGRTAGLPRPLRAAIFDAMYEDVRLRQRAGELTVPYLGTDFVSLGLTAPGERGIGFEVEHRGGDTAQIAQALHAARLAANPTMDRYHASHDPDVWSYQLDSTVSGEWVSRILYMTAADLADLCAGVDILRRHGARPDPSAGMHVHVGTGTWRRRPEWYQGLLTLYHAHQDLIYRLSAPGVVDHRGDGYCRPIPRCLPPLVSAAEMRDRYSNRYYGVHGVHVTGSPRDHLEFRTFNSSLDMGIMEAQIKFVLALLRAAEAHPLAALDLLPVMDRGAHLGRNPREEYLTGAAWEEQTAQFRQLVTLLYERPEDQRQFVALYALGRWQPAPHQRRLCSAVKRDPRDGVIAERRAAQLSLHVCPLTEADAARVADLLARRNRLTVAARSAQILRDGAAYYLVSDGNGALAACARLERAQWYQANLSRFTVDDGRDLGVAGGILLAEAERQALAAGHPLMQTTIEEEDVPVQRLFARHGYRRVARFHNALSARVIGVWQLVRATRRRQDVSEAGAPLCDESGTDLALDPSTFALACVPVATLTPAHAAMVARLPDACDGACSHAPDAASAADRHVALVTDRATDTVVGCAAVETVSWYQHELRFLALTPGRADEHIRSALVSVAVRSAGERGARLLQCALGDGDYVWSRALLRHGFTRLSRFSVPAGRRRAYHDVWGVVLAPAPAPVAEERV